MELEKLEFNELNGLKIDIESDQFKCEKKIKNIKLQLAKLELEHWQRLEMLIYVSKLIESKSEDIFKDDEDDFKPWSLDHDSAKS